MQRIACMEERKSQVTVTTYTEWLNKK